MAVDAQFYSENLGFPICGSHQDWAINPVSGFGFGGGGGGGDDFYFNNNQPQQLTTTQLHQYQSSDHHQPNLGFDHHHCCGQGQQQGASSSSASSSCENSSLLSMAFSQFLASEVDKQRQEIDLFLQFQNERLRVALQEQRKQQLAIFLHNLESKAMNIMRQKEEEIAKATKKTMELQDCLRRAEMESQSWQRVAKANEAMVIHLNTTIEQVREKLMLESNGAGFDDAESICSDFYHQNREIVNGVEKQRKAKGSSSSSSSMVGCCKHCKSQNSCMLFLPCKHLCSCKSCETLLGFCPVCKSVKDGCLEVFLV